MGASFQLYINDKNTRRSWPVWMLIVAWVDNVRRRFAQYENFSLERLTHYLVLSVCLFVTLICRILPKATGQSFHPIKLQICTSKVQGPTGYPFWRLGGWDPLRGFFAPSKRPSEQKKLRLTTRNCVKHIPHGQTKFLVTKSLTRDTPEWSC